ncbi:trimethylamine methyltransferase family protein [Rhodovibrionaceae bacterium A322]
MARRSGRRSSNRLDNSADARSPLLRPVFAQGGRFRPLSDEDVRRITDCAFDILETIGLSGLPDRMAQKLQSLGARQRRDGRICFDRDLVAGALARAPRHVDLPGFTPDQDLRIGGGRVHIGTGGAAVQVLDSETGAYKDTCLQDLYDLMRVLDASPNVHYGVRPVVARDLSSPLELDLNTAFACLKATAKPIGVSFSDPSHVTAVTDLFDMALGGPGRFAERPFCLAVIVHVVPPLRFAEEGVETLEAALTAGMIPQICSAGQAGATSPASLAGALAQGLAESLAGLVLVDAIKPGAPCIYAFMPFIADLRTGAMTGGSGEAAVANAAAAQLLSHIGLPSTVSAGMTDAKTQDVQAGYEKGYTISAAGQAGADMINLSVGMLGSIMVASPEALVIDDDMCGAILRSIQGIDISPEGLDLAAIERVVTQEGHYLAESETLKRMKSEYLYPALADRQSVDDWIESGRQSLWDKARSRVREILASPPPRHLSSEAEAKIRAAFPIRLKEQDD